jgi:hypothetical protein
MQTVLEAFRSPSTKREQGMRTLIHMMLSSKQLLCQVCCVKLVPAASRKLL